MIANSMVPYSEYSYGIIHLKYPSSNDIDW